MKAAKILSIVVVSVAAAGLVAVTGWMTYAHSGEQDTQEHVYDLAAMTTLELYKEGKQLKEEGRYAEALSLVQEADQRGAGHRPAAILAGVCLDKLGRHEEALQRYLYVIDHLKSTGQGRDFLSTALYLAASNYWQSRKADKALELLRIQKVHDPIGRWRIKGVALRGEIEGYSTAEIDAMVARESEAADLYRQARDWAIETYYKSPEPLALFDQVINDYPETGAAFQALTQKAELLWHLARREEMCNVYDAVREILRTYSGTENIRQLLRVMDRRIGEHRAQQLLRQIVTEQARGNPISTAQWDHLDVLWHRWHHNSDHKILPELFKVKILYMTYRYDDALQETKAVLQRYYEPHPDRIMDSDYKDRFADAHLLAAQALRRLGRYNEALGHLQAVVEMAKTTPPIRERYIVPTAYYLTCRTLEQMGAHPNECGAVIDEYFTYFPNLKGRYTDLLEAKWYSYH